MQQIVPTEFYEIPEGPIGTRETLKHMRDLVERAKRSTWLRHRAQWVCRWVAPKDYQGEICAILDYVRATIRYSLDVNGIEVIQGPQQTLALGYGDCDDFCVLLAALLELKGHACLFCAIGFDDPIYYSHVIVLCSAAGEDELIPLDATEPYPPGWFPPGATCAMLCEIG